jgi:hypothetical protein
MSKATQEQSEARHFLMLAERGKRRRTEEDGDSDGEGNPWHRPRLLRVRRKRKERTKNLNYKRAKAKTQEGHLFTLNFFHRSIMSTGIHLRTYVLKRIIILILTFVTPSISNLTSPPE